MLFRRSMRDFREGESSMLYVLYGSGGECVVFSRERQSKLVLMGGLVLLLREASSQS